MIELDSDGAREKRRALVWAYAFFSFALLGFIALYCGMYLTPDGVGTALAFGLGVLLAGVLIYQAPGVMLTTILNWREWRLPVLWVIGGIYLQAEWELGPRVAWRLRGGVWVAMTVLLLSWLLGYRKRNRRAGAGPSASGRPETTDG